ncbi:MAG: hypothetical protein CL753_07250 [Chloroflexi bacterium]|nr:hypothetical protein [Chloroflexota bacterium]
MATNIVMPQMGYDMREGTVVKWYKGEGEEVARGEVIADIETDKATVEFEAYTSGVLRRIIADEGVSIPVGELIAVIAGADEVLDEIPTSSTDDPEDAVTPVATTSQKQNDIGETTAPVPPQDTRLRASPIARRLAQEKNIDLAVVTGTGPGGRITEQDVLEFVSPVATSGQQPNIPSSVGSGDKVELSRMRQVIAKVTSDSKREAPHFYVTAEIDMGKAMEFRRDINDSFPADNRVSVNDMVLKASSIVLEQYPKFNGSFQENYLQLNSSINIGMAIALEAGLIVPGINDCGNKSLRQIAAASKDLIDRANNGTLRNEEYSGTTFSVSNLGMFDVDSFAAIIFPPHAAVLAVGTVRQQPVVKDGQIAVGQVMKATLSTDHRVADGAEAAQFLVEIKKLLETPVSLLL